MDIGVETPPSTSIPRSMEIPDPQDETCSWSTPIIKAPVPSSPEIMAPIAGLQNDMDMLGFGEDGSDILSEIVVSPCTNPYCLQCI
jgi:hypothetical protein